MAGSRYVNLKSGFGQGFVAFWLKTSGPSIQMKTLSGTGLYFFVFHQCTHFITATTRGPGQRNSEEKDYWHHSRRNAGRVKSRRRQCVSLEALSSYPTSYRLREREGGVLGQKLKPLSLMSQPKQIANLFLGKKKKKRLQIFSRGIAVIIVFLLSTKESDIINNLKSKWLRLPKKIRMATQASPGRLPKHKETGMDRAEPRQKSETSG